MNEKIEKFLNFLNTDFEKLDPETPMQWLELYNLFLISGSMKIDQYYNLFSSEIINYELEKLLQNPNTYLRYKNADKVIMYFYIVQERLKHFVKSEIIAFKNDYFTEQVPCPVDENELVIKKIKTSASINFKSNEVKIIEGYSWNESPKNFEILINRVYQEIKTDKEIGLKYLHVCKQCRSIFYRANKTSIVCDKPDCKNKNREQNRAIKEKKDLDNQSLETIKALKQ